MSLISTHTERKKQVDDNRTESEGHEVNGGTEVRRLHIVFFLSRKGLTEHPHLVRVHHHSRNGIRLRDVKRWLGELRGKDMPELFSWSYKRKYKAGYLWQDLFDDDLITPISDNEYVLKGSEVSTLLNREFTYLDKEHTSLKSEAKEFKNSSEISMDISSKSSFEIEQEFPTFGSETSTLTDDTMKNGDQEIDAKMEDSKRFHSSRLKKRNKSNVRINEKITPVSASAPESASSGPNLNKSKNHNSNAFRNFITCGGMDTNDSAVVMVNRHNNVRPFMSMCSGDERNIHSAQIIRKRDKIGGSQRILGNPNWTQQHWSGRKSCDGGKDSMKNKCEFRDQGALHTAAKPINRPNCSQCGKQFKPEKLHSHMKSCKGLKAFSKVSMSMADTETPLERSAESHNKNSVSGHLLISH